MRAADDAWTNLASERKPSRELETEIIALAILAEREAQKERDALICDAEADLAASSMAQGHKAITARKLASSIRQVSQ